MRPKRGIIATYCLTKFFSQEDIVMKWEELPELDWDRKLAYFLDPANQPKISREELQEALAILASMYCDEHYNLRYLECYIEEELGSDKLEEAIENSVEFDAVVDRNEYVMEQPTVEDRMRAALDFVNRIADEYDDLAGDNDDDF